MTVISLDLSTKADLLPLARLVAAIREASPNQPFILAGAQARDLILKSGYGIATGRLTGDVDFAFQVESWDGFHAFRDTLIATGQFSAVPGKIHKLRFRGVLEMDIIPFGEIERKDRTIAWPPDGDFVMSTFGFKEVAGSTIDVLLPEDQRIAVVSLPALAILKLEAWKDRRYLEPGKDAYDLSLILRNYIDAGNQDRLYGEHSALLEADGFDYESAGAYLLGHDMGKLLDRAGHDLVGRQIANEADNDGALKLAGDMPIELEKSLDLLAALEKGFFDAAPK